jgi:hypothetical protein
MTIQEVPNKTGIRCAACHRVPDTWYSAFCPKGCTHRVLACGYCASRSAVETEMGSHLESCTGAGVSDPGGTLTGIADSAGFSLKDRESLTRKAARLGAQMGETRGGRAPQVGAVVGALAGAFVDHTLGKPEVAPVLRGVRTLAGLVGAIRSALPRRQK